MKLSKLYLLTLPLLLSFAQSEEITVNAESKQDFYRTIETDAEGWEWNGFEAFENVDASKSWEHGTFEKNKTGTYRFKGTDIKILGYKGLVGGSIEVDIDGNKETVSLSASSDQYQQLLYSSYNLSDDWHTITITSLEDGKWHCIDAIQVNMNKEAYLENYNLALVGNIMCSVMNPTGGGNHDINVIRNEKYYEVGTSGCGPAQYDSYNGSGRGYFYVGFVFEEEIPFSKLVFQEGDTWFDGGWFADGDIKVEVRHNGSWTAVTLNERLNYPSSDNRADFGVSCEIYTFNFETITGDAIRLIGMSGGSSNFVSIAQIEVYSNPDALTLHTGYDYKAACIFEANKQTPDGDTSETPSEEPSVEPSEQPSTEPNEPTPPTPKKGCKGTASTTLIALASLAGILFIKRKKN